MNKKGFSLIEILVVVVIIGTLVAIILPNAFKATEQGKTTATAASVKGLKAAAMTCYMDTVANGGGGGNNWTACDSTAELTPYTDPGVITGCTINAAANAATPPVITCP